MHSIYHHHASAADAADFVVVVVVVAGPDMGVVNTNALHGPSQASEPDSALEIQAVSCHHHRTTAAANALDATQYIPSATQQRPAHYKHSRCPCWRGSDATSHQSVAVVAVR